MNESLTFIPMQYIALIIRIYNSGMTLQCAFTKQTMTYRYTTMLSMTFPDSNYRIRFVNDHMI